MSFDITKLPRQFKTKPLAANFSADQVDEENGIIRNVTMAMPGKAKGHGLHIEEKFLQELIAYDIKHWSKQGLRNRFSHPSMSDSAMGSQMGRFKNFRFEDGKAIADLHLLESAELSPKRPGMRSWMLSMAKEDPGFVMMSIVFKAGYYYQKDDKGEEYLLAKRIGKTHDYEKVNEYNAAFGDIYAGFGENGEHAYTDTVEAGAVTDNLFSQQFNQDAFAVQTIEFVQENPDLLKFLQDNPTKLTEFAAKLDIKLPKPSYSFNDKLKAFGNLFFSNDEADVKAAFQKEFQEELDKLNTQLTEKDKEIQSLKSGGADLQDKLDKANEELKTKDARITELEELVPDDHSDPDKKQTGKTQKKQFDRVTQRAIKKYKRWNAHKA